MPRGKYETSLGDEWDGIAYKVYRGRGGEMLTHLLLEANPKHRETVIFSSGVMLDVPEAPDRGIPSMPPWMR